MKYLFLAAAALSASPAFALEIGEKMAQYAQGQLSAIAGNADVIAAIHSQNAETSGLSEAEIIALDNVWRSEVDGSDRPMITAVLANPVSEILASLVAQSPGVITEVFVMDARGLNVGQSAITSDYWQGDEAKFTKTYPMGSDAMHVSDVELDQSTQAYQGQVSMSITDPTTGETIGAVTFGVSASPFF